MKYRILTSLFISVVLMNQTCLFSKRAKGRYLIDQTEVKVYGPEQDRVICKSEIDRLGFDGRLWSKRDLILDELLEQERIKYKFPIEDAVVDRYIASNNLSDQQVKEIFNKAGYTVQEGRDQLKRMYGSQMIVDSKIRARLVVPEREVIAYYNANPIMKEAKYQIQAGFVEYAPTAAELEQSLAIKEKIKTGSGVSIEWNDPFWLKTSELADSMQYIKTMKVGEISEPQMVAGGFEMYRLKNFKPERAVPLHKRYRQIVSILQRPKFETMLNAYQEELLHNAFIADYSASPSA